MEVKVKTEKLQSQSSNRKKVASKQPDADSMLLHLNRTIRGGN